MERKFSNKILSPRQAEIRRRSGDSIEAAVGGTAGMYQAFSSSLKKAQAKVSRAISSVIDIIFPPAQMSIINREPPQLPNKLPALSEFIKRPLPVPKPLHSDSGTLAPTPGRFDDESERINLDHRTKRNKPDCPNFQLIPFKASDKMKLATPVWKKYQFKLPERMNFKNIKSQESKNEPEKIKITVGNSCLNEEKKANDRRLDEEPELTKRNATNIKSEKDEQTPKLSIKNSSAGKEERLNERGSEDQRIKNLDQKMHFSEEKKLPESSVPSTENSIKKHDKIDTPGPNSTPIYSRDSNAHTTSQEKNLSKNPFASEPCIISSEESSKKIELTPEFGKNAESKIAELKAKNSEKDSASITNNETALSSSKTQAPPVSSGSFFMPEAERKLPDMTEGFHPKPESKKLSQNSVISVSVDDLSGSQLINDSKPTPSIAPSASLPITSDSVPPNPFKISEASTIDQKSPVFPVPSPSKNPFISANPVNQSKPLYIFGSATSAHQPIPNSMQINPVPHAEVNPGSSSSPFASNPIVLSTSQNLERIVQNPFAANPVSFPYITSAPSSHFPPENRFQQSSNISQPPNTNPFAPSNDLSSYSSMSNPSTSNPFGQNPSNYSYQAQPPPPISNPFSTSHPGIANPFSTSSSTNPIISNPFQPTSFNSSSPFQTSSISNSNPNIQNPFTSSNPGINPRPNMYSSSFGSRDVEMGAEAPTTQPSYNSGSFNLGNFPERNIIRGRRPK